MEETWRPIPGYETVYSISDSGCVRRDADSASTTGCGWKGNRIIKPHKDGCGYWFVLLSKNGKRKQITIHRLLLSAFVRPPDKDEQGNHLNCNKTDNRIENLEWTTRKGNASHARDNGLYQTGTDHWTNRNAGATVGIRNGRAKLTDRSVGKIRALHKSCTNDALAKRFKVSVSTIERIVGFRSWKHL